MVSWLRPLYMDEQIKEKPAVIRYRFKFKKYPGNYYYIILPDGQDMPEIIRAAYLKQPWYKNTDYAVVGVAREKASALKLFCRMAEDAYHATGGVNIRGYLRGRGVR